MFFPKSKVGFRDEGFSEIFILFKGFVKFQIEARI
tara:strand:+ start:117 stop:221 length:105 start_codon:yes stop_codon:yes gene_type:complete